MTAANPLSERSELPFELPPFSRIHLDDYRQAFADGMSARLAEIETIVANPDPPTFANTIEAMEGSGRLLHRTSISFFNVLSSNGTPDFLALEAEVSPQLTAHYDAVSLNPELFARITAVHQHRSQTGLQPAAIRLVERYHRDFARSGAQLSADDAATMRDINQQLSVLATTFGQNLLAGTRAAAVLVTDATELDGLSTEDVDAAAEQAAEAGQPGKYLIPLVLPTGQPSLARLTNRSLRQRIHEASVGRASAGQYDNGPIAIKIANLRARRARLLGFGTHADFVAADGTAKTSAAVDELLSQLVRPAVVNARAEAARMSELAGRDGIQLAAWDCAFYSERIRAENYSVDRAALRPYLELNRVLQDGVFYAATQLYGITFELREDLAGYHPDVRVFEVEDADGHSLGLFLFDPFARDTKRGGAWMNTFVDQSELLGQRPIVVNNMNVTKPAPGEPALLTTDSVRTLFHEFGHALHGLFSQVRYPRFSGTSVPGDFVEYPSQVNEMWQWWPQVLGNYAFHIETGEALPVEVVERITAAELWGAGFATVEYLGATLLDQAWHRISAEQVITDAQAFEREALEKAGLGWDLVPPRYRTTYFQHIFSGGYSAGYYFYIWAEVLDADTVEWVNASGGLTRENGDILRGKLLAIGGEHDPMEAVRSILGRDPVIGPLLRRRGLVS